MIDAFNRGLIGAVYENHMGDDLSVVNAARVSFDKRSLDFGDKDAKLVNYLAEHKHMSPFGHCFASFVVKAPIFVARQLVKHKFLRWNEISRRYVDEKPKAYIPDEWRGKPVDKKQGSSGVIEVDEGTEMHVNYYVSDAFRLYEHLLNQGVCPEQARMVLPQNTMTSWWWSGSLDAFADMCRLRLAPDTQEETRIVASDIDKVMKDLFPVSWKALMEVNNGRS